MSPPSPFRLLPVVLALVAGFIPASSSGADHWRPVGPQGAAVVQLARASAAPEIVFAPTNPGGLYRSTDGGATWTSLLDRLPVPRIRAVAVGAAGETVAIGSTEDAIWFSRDGGESWSASPIPEPPRFYETFALAVAPSDGDRVYAAGRGIWRSDDGGASWSPVHAGTADEIVIDLAVHPTDPDIAWAVLFAQGAFRTLDGGATWQNVLDTSQVPVEILTEVAVDPAAPDTVYVAGPRGLRVSQDGGTTWSDPRMDSVVDVAPDPSVAGSVLVIREISGGDPPGSFLTPLYRVTEGGTRWTRLDTLPDRLTDVLPGAADRPLLAIAAFQGVIRSRADGTTWQPSNQGFHTARISAFDLVPFDPSTVHAALAAPYRLTRSRDGAASWPSERSLEAPFGATADRIIAHPQDADAAYVLFVNSVARFDSATATYRILLSKAQHYGLAVDPRRPDRLYAVTGDDVIGDPHHLFTSSDGGDTWSELPLPGGVVRAGWDVAVDPERPGVLYVAASSTVSPGGSVLRSDDGGTSWTVLGLGTLPPVRRLAAQPGEVGTRLYALTFTRKLFVSDDGGASWSRPADGLPPAAEVSSVAVPARAEGPVVVGTRGHGVFRRHGQGPWRPVGEGLPALTVDAVRFVPGTDVVLALLRNGGLWRVGVPDACPAHDPELLCLGEDGRFRAEVVWRTSRGGEGRGSVGALDPALAAGAWGWLWFFSPHNAELAVKLLDGRPVNGHWWLFYASMTDVAFDLLVTDTERGAFRVYPNPSGSLASRGDTTAFRQPPDGAGGGAAGIPLPSATALCGGGPGALCLRQGRFRVEVAWEDFAGERGDATGEALSRDSGYLWFFRPSNPEIFVKVLDGRPVNGRWWVFYGALSNVAFEVTVTDTLSGASKSYANPAGHFASIADTTALP